MTKVLSAALLYLLFVLRVAAQTSDPATNALIDGMYREVERSKAEILKKLSATLDNREKAVFDRIRFVIDRNGWNIYAVYADSGIVNISMGFMTHVNMIDGALAYEMYDSAVQNTTRNLGRPIDYANYYVDTLEANSRAFRLGRAATPPKSYFQWLGMSASDIDALSARLNGAPQYRQISTLVSEGNLAMVLAHELGHHVLGHVPVRSPLTPEKEAAADAFAFTHVVKAGYPPLLALGTFMMFDRFERADEAQPRSGNHPPALCRWFRAMTSGWTAIKDDPNLVADLAQRGRSAEITQMDELLRRGEREFAEKCPALSSGLCSVITRFLSEPPKAFVAARGKPVDPGLWEAKSDLPNGSCSLKQKDLRGRTSHTFYCSINAHNSEAVVSKYYEVAVTEITACIAGMRNGAGWSQSPSNDADNGEITTGQEWTYSEGATTYNVSIDKIVNAGRERYQNFFRINYIGQASP